MHISKYYSYKIKGLFDRCIPSYCIVVGSSAKYFDTERELKILLKNNNSKYAFDEINSIYKVVTA